MATSYPSVTTDPPEGQWQDSSFAADEAAHYRSVTPAMANTRSAARNASPAPVRGPSPSAASKAAGSSNIGAHYAARSRSPSGRYLGSFNTPEETQTPSNGNGPNPSGLIRLILRKPMGIVFEPMYDPITPSIQRGVRICDLPRTGAAALSRKLEVGDELLSINDKTMSRLSFDEIMDFIIDADPEAVKLLFRRPRKEVLNARNGIKASSASNVPGVKWVDDEARKHKDTRKDDYRKDKKGSRRPKYRDDDSTLQSEDFSYRRGRKNKKRDPYESESFLDILIDTICAAPDQVCRDGRRRRNDYDYYSEDDETFDSRDESTYVTYESEERMRTKKKFYEEERKKKNDAMRSSTQKKKESQRPEKMNKKEEKYEDDGTLETVESMERAKPVVVVKPEHSPPLGLAPNPNPRALGKGFADMDDEGNPAPIREVEYDEDQGADVSVMESLGGPSLLIEKQRQAAIVNQKEVESCPPVSDEIMNNFGKDYPLDFGFTREQTIQNDPLRFYSFIVMQLLQEHEPEKVRLLDKLLAKYRGREDHLVQKLSVRYNKEEEEFAVQSQPHDFEAAVNKRKESSLATANIQAARERMHNNDFNPTWPDKETKEPEEEEEDEEEDDNSVEYSEDSIDGTSPAVIAQVSELLNYVYGKTSVPGQIDRVSTIMRAYEGREAVLLELLETKALIKANREKENAGQLPAFLKNSANAQRDFENEISGNGDMPPVTPMATQPPAAMNDDISSMSGVSNPAVEGQQNATVLKQISVSAV